MGSSVGAGVSKVSFCRLAHGMGCIEVGGEGTGSNSVASSRSPFHRTRALEALADRSRWPRRWRSNCAWSWSCYGRSSCRETRHVRTLAPPEGSESDEVLQVIGALTQQVDILGAKYTAL